MCECVKEIYYKKLAHMIMEAGKSQDLQGESASWRLGRTAGIVPVQMPVDLKPGKNQCLCSRLKAGKKPMSQFEGSQAGRMISDFGVYAGLQLIGRDTPTLRRAICLLTVLI